MPDLDACYTALAEQITRLREARERGDRNAYEQLLWTLQWTARLDERQN